jgi:exodeoxyribonuclease VII large subunit
MAKPLKSQWDAGELFPTEQIRKVFSVTELTGSIRRTLEKEIGLVWVSGEISNLKIQNSGHVYFSIKDANAQLACVMFRTEAQAVQHEFLEDGQKVILHGQITVYEPRGQYQMRVMSLELRGVGALQVAFEKLKQKLNAEGLFDPKRKRPIPPFPRRIGVVTSTNGAAIRDVLHVMERRAPMIDFVLANCHVQGSGAGAEIACGISWLNEWSASALRNKVDVLLVTRGGGSLEDLWAFNEEVVARAIFKSHIPVISAVGHEIDFTISDFVSDFRAATPSVAAEILSDGFYSSRQFIAEAQQILTTQFAEHLSWKKQALEAYEHRLNRLQPKRRLQQQFQLVDELQEGLRRCVRTHLRAKARSAGDISKQFSRTRLDIIIKKKMAFLQESLEALQLAVESQIQQRRARLGTAAEQLRLLSPRTILDRGYSITLDSATGKVIRESDSVHEGQELLTHVKQGSLRSIAKRKEL